MKTIVTAFLLLFSTSLFAQIKKVKVLESTIGALMCAYTKSIDLDKGDTTYYVYLAFQNEKYKSITDVKSLFFTQKEQLEQFKKDLTSALAEMENKDSEISWKKPEYEINKYNFSKALYIYNKSAYFTYSKKEVTKLLKWLARIDLGSDTLNPEVKD